MAYLFAAAVPAQWASDSPGRPSDPGGRRASATAATEPSFGLNDPSILTLYAWDFHPVDDRIVTGTTFAGSWSGVVRARVASR